MPVMGGQHLAASFFDGGVGSEVVDCEGETENPMRRSFLILILVALVVSACGGDDGDSADAEIAVVLSALEAKNSFDLDGWLMALEGGQRVGVPVFAEEILMNAEERWEVVEACQVTGENSSSETGVKCLIQETTTSYWAVGGISDTKNQVFLVNTDGLISLSGHFGSSEKNGFNRAFHQWLSDTYPDVYNEMGYGSISSNAPGFDTKNPDHMLIAVEYVEEFVAQSDEYPLDQ